MKTLRPPAAKASDNYVEIPPNAARTLAALRELGYDSVSAICDLIDNSVDAGAKHVAVNVRQIGKNLLVEVIDNGCGMSHDRLREALRLGSDTPHESDDLGKYGMGLTTASLSIAKTIFVLTREKGKQGYEATFDVSTVERENQWVLDLRPAKTPMVLEEVGDYGTLVRLTNIDRIDDTNPNRFAQTLREEIGRIFRYYLKDGLKITVNRRVVEAVDPLMREHELTEQKFDADIELGHGHKAHLTIVELPDLGPADDEAMGIVPQMSGFYIVRNRREIMAAQTLDFYKHHHSYSHFRAELSFSRDIDTLFHVDVKKTAVHPNDQVLEKIRHAARRYIEASGRVGRERAIQKTQLNHALTLNLLGGVGHMKETPTKEPSKPAIDFNESDHGSPDVLFKIEKIDGSTVLNYNKRHPLVRMIADARLQKGIAILDCVCLALAQIAQEDKAGQAVVERINRTLLNILAAGTDADTWEARDQQAKKK